MVTIHTNQTSAPAVSFSVLHEKLHNSNTVSLQVVTHSFALLQPRTIQFLGHALPVSHMKFQSNVLISRVELISHPVACRPVQRLRVAGVSSSAFVTTLLKAGNNHLTISLKLVVKHAPVWFVDVFLFFRKINDGNQLKSFYNHLTIR